MAGGLRPAAEAHFVRHTAVSSMKGSSLLRLCLLLPVAAGVIAYAASADVVPRLVALIAVAPYTLFALFFWRFTIQYSERQLRHAILVAPLVFIPVLAVFIVLGLMGVFGQLAPGVALCLAAACSIAVGYLFVGVALGICAVLRRLGVVTSEASG